MAGATSPLPMNAPLPLPRRFLLPLVCLLLSGSATADELIEKARALLEKDQTEAAMKLLKREMTDERMEDPAHMLLAADILRLHSPHIPVLNGGDRMRVNYFKDAGGMYRQVQESKKASDIQKMEADISLAKLMHAMMEEARRAEKAHGAGQLLRIGEAMVEVWPDRAIGHNYIYRTGNLANDPELQLRGLRGVIACGEKQAQVYTLGAMLEQGPEGAGAEAALKHLDAGLAVLPNQPGLLETKARLLVQLKRPDEALAVVKALETVAAGTADKSNRALQLGTAGMIHDSLGNAQQAEALLMEGIKGRPDLLPFRFSLGSLHFNRVVRDQGALMELDPGSAKAAELEKAIAGKLAKARAQFEAAHQLQPQQREVMHTLLQIYQLQKDDEAFLKMRKAMRAAR